MKKLVLSTALLIVMVVVIAGLVYGTNAYLTNQDNKAAAMPVECLRLGANHTAVIVHDKVSPATTLGALCDTLTIINKDNRLRVVAFGPFEHHTPYDGITEVILSQDQSFTVTMNQVGSFTFHDHEENTVVGYFTVTKP